MQRWGHSSAITSNGDIVVYGGYGAEVSVVRDATQRGPSDDKVLELKEPQQAQRLAFGKAGRLSSVLRYDAASRSIVNAAVDLNTQRWYRKWQAIDWCCSIVPDLSFRNFSITQRLSRTCNFWTVTLPP